MTRKFHFQGSSAQIVFGNGSYSGVCEWVEKLGCKRALVLSTLNQKEKAEKFSALLGKFSAGMYANAKAHTPVEVTEDAMKTVRATNADCLLAVGGGSTIGLGKAIALRTDLPQIVIPTTYSGSEATPNLGQTEAGIKTTTKDEKIRPEVVIYDPDLTLELPLNVSISSGLNAMAHAAEGLYAKDRNPVSTLLAIEGLATLKNSLPNLCKNVADPDARSDALYGAWLCGTVLGMVGMALHHKICHVLGGMFNTPHADTHAILLPYTICYNAVAASAELQPLSDMFENEAGVGLYDFASKIGAPKKLSEIGLHHSDLKQVADLAIESPYWNPAPVTSEGIHQLLQDAWEGKRPNPKSKRRRN